MYINDEQEHIEMILKGDSAAYRFLVEKNKEIVYSVAFRILNNTQDAEDAAQESFIKAYHQLHTFKGKSKFSTWLCTIAYRVCLAKLKANSLENAIGNEGIESYFDAVNSPYEELTEKEKTARIKNAIQKLPKIDSLLIILYYFNDNSINEIEEITGLRASNIKVRLFRARKILEHELKFLL
jgi:RNA polymerase sigma-70 factor (ECF subfamily)